MYLAIGKVPYHISYMDYMNRNYVSDATEITDDYNTCFFLDLLI